MDDLVSREFYTYLGKISGVFFFIHSVYAERSEDVLARMGGDVYNCLIQETMVRKGNGLVVFNVLVGRGGSVLPTYVRHATFPAETFPTGTLEHVLRRLCAAQRPPTDGIFSIAAVFAAGSPSPEKYELYELPGSIGAALSSESLNGVVFLPLQQMISTKPIPYL